MLCAPNVVDGVGAAYYLNNESFQAVQKNTQAARLAKFNAWFSAARRWRGRGTARVFTGHWTDENGKHIPRPFKSVVVISLGIPILLMAPPMPPRTGRF